MFNEFRKDTEHKEIYSPKYLKKCLILSMFFDGYSIEDIIYVTNTDMKNLAKYISTDMIIERRGEDIDWTNLYGGILNR